MEKTVLNHRVLKDYKSQSFSRNPQNINTQININIEVVPKKFIMKNSQKYMLRKSAINNKFDWLNKYLNSITPGVASPFGLYTKKINRVVRGKKMKTEPD